MAYDILNYGIGDNPFTSNTPSVDTSFLDVAGITSKPQFAGVGNTLPLQYASVEPQTPAAPPMPTSGDTNSIVSPAYNASTPTQDKAVIEQSVNRQATPDDNATVGRTPNAAVAQKNYEEARLKWSPTRHDDDNVYRSPITGAEYEKPHDSHWADAGIGIMGAMSGYLESGGSETGAMEGAYKAVKDHDDKVHRFSQIEGLEKDGNTPPSIQKYLEAGDLGDLTKDKKETFGSAESGYFTWERDPKTGQQVAVPIPGTKAAGKTPGTFGSAETGYFTIGADGKAIPLVAGTGAKDPNQGKVQRTLSDGTSVYMTGAEAARFDDNQAKKNAPPTLSTKDQVAVSSRWHTDNKIPLDEFDKRMSSGNQLVAAAGELAKGNTFANNSVIANFMKTEAPNLSPRMSQYALILEHSGSSVNGAQRLLNKVVNGQDLTEEDSKDLQALAKVQQFIAYNDLKPVIAQRQALIDEEHVKPSYLRTITKPEGYDEWDIGQRPIEQLHEVAAKNPSTKPDGVYKTKTGGYIRIQGGKGYTLPSE